MEEFAYDHTQCSLAERGVQGSSEHAFCHLHATLQQAPEGLLVAAIQDGHGKSQLIQSFGCQAKEWLAKSRTKWYKLTEPRKF